MHQAFTRAHVKLSFAFGLGHLIANTTGVVRFDHIQEKLGQMWNMVELTRSAIVSREAGSRLDDDGVWYPDDRPFLALRGEMPKWLPNVQRAPAADRRRRLHVHADARPTSTARSPSRSPSTTRRPARTPSGGSGCSGSPGTTSAPTSAARGELYERFYLSDSWRMTALAYKIADKSFPESLVEQFLHD